MNKRNLYIFILIASIILFLALFYYLGIFSGKSLSLSEDSKGVSGEVSNVSVSNKNIVIKDDTGENINIKLDKEVKILNLFNRPVKLSSVESGNFVNILGHFNKENSINASEVNVVDSDSNSEITVYDKGKEFIYNLGSEFKVILNDSNYSLSNLSCSPSGIINNITESPGANPPYYAAKFEAISPGECKLKNKDFSVDIRVEE